MLFKPLAVERGDELIWLSSASTKPNGPRGNLTYPDVADLDALDVLRGATAFGFFQANLAADGGALRLNAQAVMGNFFDVVGVSAARGRMLAASPAAASERGVVISYGIWQRLFGGRDEAIGQAVKINGRDFTVVGVAPRGFRGVDVSERADLWIPLTLASEANPDNAAL